MYNDKFGAGVICKEFNASNFRLYGGSNASEGSLQFLYDGRWMGLCEDSLDWFSYHLACKQLGFDIVKSFGVNTLTTITQEDILPFVYQCYTIDKTFDDCYLKVYSDDNCTKHGRIKTTCSTYIITDVRLVEGSDSSEGRVEMFDGEWKTVCKSGIGTATFDTICRQIGWKGAMSSGINPGDATDQIIPYSISCSSTETTLSGCTVYNSNYSCSHDNDISVKCSDFSVTNTRLVNGSSANEGRLELEVDGEWMTVCDSTFNSGYAPNTLCKSMGYRSVVEILRGAHFGQGSGGIVSNFFSCDKEANSLNDCSVQYFESSSCQTHSNDMSVICGNLQVEAIRLVDGPSSLEGRVEMLVDNEWRTVCGSYWNSNDADVLCKSLGFRESEEYYSNAYFGQGAGKVLNNDFICTGQESHLDNCTITYRGFSCSHSRDFCVKCVDPDSNDKLYYVYFKACGDLPIPANGHVTISGTSHGDFVRFNCRPGYSLTGPAFRVCMANNTWNGTEPKCVKDCGDTAAPQNGSVNLPNRTIYTATVTYQCDTGFDMVGMSNRTCLENGMWSGSSPTCKIRDCGLFEPPQNGTVDFSLGTVYTSIAVLNCVPGFTLYGEQTRQCLQDGTWGGINPLCLVTTDEKIPPDNDGLKEGFLYGGIGLALVVGMMAGVLVAVCVQRKRVNTVNKSTTVHENKAFSSSELNDGDHYENINSSDEPSRDSRPDYMVMDQGRI